MFFAVAGSYPSKVLILRGKGLKGEEDEPRGHKEGWTRGADYVLSGRGDHGREGGRESAQGSRSQKGDTAAATMTMMMMTQKKERKNVGRKTTDKIASSNADDDGRGKNCTHLIYAAAFLPWEVPSRGSPHLAVSQARR